ncbi:MAG: DUF899 domain-containing protein [Streptosporangiaceae bacterium]
MSNFEAGAAQHVVGNEDEHRAARLALLAREKELNRLRDELAAERRRLPWVPVTKDYQFEGPDGRLMMRDLFDGRSQLIVYHFMFGPDWEEGCPSCSLWADSFNGMPVHLAHRDASMVAVSRAPFAQLEEYRQRMWWSFRWVSSAGSDFNYDYGVSFTPEQQADGAQYNYRPSEVGDELPGLSVFAMDEDGQVFHTYSTYSRGLDPFNSGYQLLDLTPKGRDEENLPWTMAWLRRHDSY